MDNCIFCKIVNGELPVEKAYEDEELLAFPDINPQAPLHLLLIPKKHIRNIMEMEAKDSDLIGRLFFKAQELARLHGCEEKGGRFVINCKSDGGQTVDHLHYHILGGRPLSWPPG